MPIVRRKKTGGRPRNEILWAYAERYRLSHRQRALCAKILPQLALCMDDSARRLLLGVSK